MHNRLSTRIQNIEAMFNQQQGRNPVFDRINEALVAL